MRDIDEFLDKIRPNRSALFGFFSMMPKGGDLHHHYSGSIYTESYIEYVFGKDLYVNEETLELAVDISTLPADVKVEWKRISQVQNPEKLKLRFLRTWSVKDFVRGERSPDEHFFSTFPAFSIPSKNDYIKGLKELKKRALNQRLSYVETIFTSISTKDIQLPNEEELDKKFLKFQENADTNGLNAELETIYVSYLDKIKVAAKNHNSTVEGYHSESDVDGDDFVLRFQNYVARYKQPVDVFIELCTCFQSCSDSKVISGVNIVGAENGEVSMRDNWLHIMFFKFLEGKYSSVKYAVHAGELVSGMVQPELLGTHIKQCLLLKNLRRIGHAVDIIYDREFSATMDVIRRKGIVIEINLSSNEFILSVANDLHPVEIYYRNGIPIVLSTDDEGVLRTSITEQYVLLAHRYKLTYSEIKGVVMNSIMYSNLEDDRLKEMLLSTLEHEFGVFEKKIVGYSSMVLNKEDDGRLKLKSLSLN